MSDVPITSAAHGLRLLADIIDANPDIEHSLVSVSFKGYEEADLARLVTVLGPTSVSVDGHTVSGEIAGMRFSIHTFAHLTSEESLVRTLTPLPIEEIRRRAAEAAA